MTDPSKLQEERSEAAQQEFEQYDFEDYNVVDASGFEWGSDSNEAYRPIFIENPDNPDGTTLLGAFTVVFDAASANVASSYATLGGEDIGKRPEKSYQPAAI